MSLSPIDDAAVPLHSFSTLDAHSLAIVPDDLPERWDDGDASYRLHRIDPTSWKVAFEGVVLGVLTLVPPITAGEGASWKIGDPQQDNLGVGARWSSWQDAVANLVDYRRAH